MAKGGHFHFCEENSMDCPVTRRGKFMHLKKFRELTQKEIDQKIPGWAFEGSCKKIFQNFLKGADLGTPGPPEKGVLPWHQSGDEETEEVRSRTRSLSPQLKAKLKKAQEELKALEEAARKQQGKLARGRGEESKPKDPKKAKQRRHKARSGSPAQGRADKEKKASPKKEKAQKKKKRRRSSSSSCQWK